MIIIQYTHNAGWNKLQQNQDYINIIFSKLHPFIDSLQNPLKTETDLRTLYEERLQLYRQNKQY